MERGRVTAAPRGENCVPAVGLAGEDGPALARLLAGLVRALADRGLRLAVLRESHASAGGDERKDTGRYRRAGACVTALAAPGLLEVTLAGPGPFLPQRLLPQLGLELDVVLVVGPAASRWPHILIGEEAGLGVRGGQAGPRLAEIADHPAPGAAPRFGPDQVEALGAYLAKRLRGEA